MGRRAGGRSMASERSAAVAATPGTHRLPRGLNEVFNQKARDLRRGQDPLLIPRSQVRSLPGPFTIAPLCGNRISMRVRRAHRCRECAWCACTVRARETGGIARDCRRLQSDPGAARASQKSADARKLWPRQLQRPTMAHSRQHGASCHARAGDWLPQPTRPSHWPLSADRSPGTNASRKRSRRDRSRVAC
jgi:hypothetical protein